jgi:bifunctional non-homologous end joining protein LigD
MTASASRKVSLTIDGRALQVSSLDKVMYPETGFTKQQVIEYYTAVADVLLPQLRNRVVTRIRYPDGTGGERFFERHLPARAPGWIRHVTISASPGTGKQAKRVRYPVIDSLAGLVWMANQAALELHTPQWHVGPRGGIGKPDRLVIDLDPGEGIGLDECARVARIAAARLAEDGLATIPVTSGSKGIHLYAAVDGTRTSLAIHAWVQKVARLLAAEHPDLIVAASKKEDRIGKVFIDWSQNHPARSTATPYTLRGRPNPTVAAPRRWDEITDGLTQLSPDEVLARLDADGDVMETGSKHD